MTEKKIFRLLGDTSGTKMIPSKKFPGIRYTPGEDVWVNDLRKDKKHPISFDLSMELTENTEAIRLTAVALDNLDGLEASAKEYLRKIAADPAHKSYKALRTYFNLYGKTKASRGEMPELSAEIKDWHVTELEGLIDQLSMERFGGITHKEQQSQAFIMDFFFTQQQYGEEVLSVYLDKALRPFVAAVES